MSIVKESKHSIDKLKETLNLIFSVTVIFWLTILETFF